MSKINRLNLVKKFINIIETSIFIINNLYLLKLESLENDNLEELYH